MASSLFVNTLQVDFTSVLTMEHAGMVRMFKTLEDTGLRGFLEGTTPIFESAVVEFFSNARVMAGTIVSTVFGKNLVVTEEIFSGTFKLPTEGMQNFSGIPNETIVEMRTRLSATTVPFQSSGKKKDLHFEYCLLHDIVAKSLCANAGSFDKVTCEKFEVMVAILAGLSVNWEKETQGWSNEDKDQTATQITTTPPDTTATKIVENRETVVSTNVDPEEDSETNSCPLVQRRCKKKQVSESSNSLPVTHILKRMRTQRHDNLDLYDQTEQDEHKNQYVNVDCPHQIVPTEGEGTNADDEQRDHGSQDPMTLDINFSEQGKGEPIHDSIPIIPVNHEGNVAYQRTANSPQKPDDVVPIQVAQEGGNPEMVEDYCTRLIMTAREKVSSRMAIFEEWVHFRLEVRLKDFSCFHPMVDIEEQLKWAETEDITELSERRSLILYNILETELEKLYLAHLANLTNVVSAHRDFECIRRLHQELRLIAAAHRHHRGLTATHASYEHKAQENEPLIQKADHEHQGQDRQGSVEGVDPRLNAIPILDINPEAIPHAGQDVSPHQDPDFSNLQFIAIAPQESSTLQHLHTATQSLNAISTHVSYLEQSYARLRDDTNITRHHTTNLRDELKSTTEGFDIRIDVLE
ncbi:hypothetical protein F511_09143 [Dorcoceras hygrometricum]|uniref:Uncharacterized protein n=1 Tax=Dorcoceras hygrometricum TaxID=472368 RepID=A0A2Z7AXL9_9LAMI|nr:hypothetical protein F511_09143 [Dorcoceras hygrometricum]